MIKVIGIALGEEHTEADPPLLLWVGGNKCKSHCVIRAKGSWRRNLWTVGHSKHASESGSDNIYHI
jgi:hypothetical protein